MGYSVKEIAGFMKVYSDLEKRINDFMFIVSSSLKDKSHAVKVSREVLVSILEYQGLPKDLREELGREDEVLQVQKKAKDILGKFG